METDKYTSNIEIRDRFIKQIPDMMLGDLIKALVAIEKQLREIYK